ncbi:MAG: hypothetical protein R3E95_18095 [Thiolinea sp.]
MDVKYRTGFWNGRPLKPTASNWQLSGELGVWCGCIMFIRIRMSSQVPLADGKILPYLDIPFQYASPGGAKKVRRPAHAEKVLGRLAVARSAWRLQCAVPYCRFSR